MVRRTRIPEQVARDLEQLLQDGVWKAGDQIPPERDLATRFGVSRASVRDALRILELQGWVQIRQGEGTKVASPADSFGQHLRNRLHEPGFVAELFELRRILEPAAAELAALRSDKPTLAGLQTLLEAQSKASHDKYLFVEADLEFHRLLARASGNSVLHEVIQLLGLELRQTRISSTARRFRPQNTLSEHRRIFQAIEHKDPQAARQAMIAHLTTIEKAAFGKAGNGVTQEVTR